MRILTLKALLFSCINCACFTCKTPVHTTDQTLSSPPWASLKNMGLSLIEEEEAEEDKEEWKGKKRKNQPTFLFLTFLCFHHWLSSSSSSSFPIRPSPMLAVIRIELKFQPNQKSYRPKLTNTPTKHREEMYFSCMSILKGGGSVFYCSPCCVHGPANKWKCSRDQNCDLSINICAVLIA